MTTGRMWAYIKKPRKLYILIGLVVVAGVAAAFYLRKTPVLEETVTAQRGTLIEEVSVTGRVKPATSVDLAFEKSGRIVSVSGVVGRQVSAGTSLAVLDSRELNAELLGTEADLKTEEAKLAGLQTGAKKEELEVEIVKVKNAEIAVEDARRAVLDKVRAMYTQTDDGVRNKSDQFFSNPRSATPSFALPADFQQKTNIEADRVRVEQMLVSWKARLDATSFRADLEADVEIAKTNGYAGKNFLESVSLIINVLKANSSLTQATIDGYRTDISAARSALDTALSNLTTAEEKYRSAVSALYLARQQYALKESGGSPEEIRAQEARVDRARANADAIRAQIAKNAIVAPIDGVITRQDAKVGEIAVPNTSLVSLISSAQYEIEANVPEADIASIKSGNQATVTLDAYGNDVVFNTRVVKIDPAETIVEGIATYKVTLQFIEKDDRIKSGMTANIDIRTNERLGVIMVPARAVISREGKKFVKISKGEAPAEERTVEVGLRGSDGSLEIRSGVSEGEKIILPGSSE